MTARDLLQQRYTLPNGDTAWRASPLVTAAQEGKLVLLDGIHRVNLGTLAVLSRSASIHTTHTVLSLSLEAYTGTLLTQCDAIFSIVHRPEWSEFTFINLADAFIQSDLVEEYNKRFIIEANKHRKCS